MSACCCNGWSCGCCRARQYPQWGHWYQPVPVWAFPLPSPVIPLPPVMPWLQLLDLTKK